MVLNVYVAFDKIGKRVVCTFSSPSDGLAVRENAPALSKVIPLGDIELRRIGSLDDESLVYTPVLDDGNKNYVSVDWNSYQFPESPLKKD